MKLNDYRCTRNSSSAQVSERQGYYIIASSEEQALAEMKKQFPKDIAGFTIVLWKEGL